MRFVSLRPSSLRPWFPKPTSQRKRGESGPVARPTSARVSWAAILVLVASTGCNEKVPQYRDEVAPSSSAAPSVPPPDAKGDSRGDARGERKRSDAAVFIDGELRAVLAYGELPAGFEPTVVDRRGDYRICNVARYLEALGVDIAKVKSLHMEGSSRTAVIDGDELRRMRDKLHFTFSKLRGTFGRPMADWPSEKVISTTRIDKISGLQVFVDKEPPVWDPKQKAFFWADGKKSEGVPYVDDFQPIRSPRVYFDGKLVGFLEQDKIPADMVKTGDGRGTGKKTEIEPEQDEDGNETRGGGRQGGGTGGGKRILLAKYLAHLGIDLAAINVVEVIGEDRVLGRFDRDAWTAQTDALTFGIPKRNGKRLRIELPDGATPYPGPVTAQAIVVYGKQKPAAREIAQPKRRPRAN